jgi:DNA-binding transcriptional ArsR family regulator
MDDLMTFNATVREWAEKQSPKYRKTAAAFAYPADMHTHSHDFRISDISKMSRKRGKGQGVSVSTLTRHLPVLERHGLISAERRQRTGRNQTSIYRIDFARIIPDETAANGGTIPTAGQAPIPQTLSREQA